MIQIYNPSIEKYKSSANQAIESGWISNHGEFIEKATTKLKEVLQVPYVILMSNGTCATHCLFLSLQYKYPEIQTIYVPNNAYVAAWNAALMVYKKENIKIMTMNQETWNIETSHENFMNLEEGAAVLIVHNLGNIVNVPCLKRIRPDLIFVEDNCEGLFGMYEGIYSGTSSSTLCSSISFYGNKIITTGEGGAFLTNDSDVYEHIKRVYSQGMSSVRYLHYIHAYNYRMTNIEAAFLYDQLNDIDNILQTKKIVFDRYKRLLKPLIQDGHIALFQEEEQTVSAEWIFAVRIIGNKMTIEETSTFFNKNGVDIRPFFYPITSHGHLKDFVVNDHVGSLLNKEVFMIPSSPSITEEEQKKVASIIIQIILIQKNIEIVNKEVMNKDIIQHFISSIQSKHFRYFNNRTIECLDNHLITLFLKDIKNEKIVGYSHIDKEDSTNWFGIYLEESLCNKKIGNLIMNYIFLNNTIIGINELSLSVDKDNFVAIRLYEKNIFETIRITNDIIYMKKVLQ